MTATQQDATAIDPKAMHVVREWRHSAMLLGCRFAMEWQMSLGESGFNLNCFWE